MRRNMNSYQERSSFLLLLLIFANDQVVLVLCSAENCGGKFKRKEVCDVELARRKSIKKTNKFKNFGSTITNDTGTKENY